MSIPVFGEVAKSRHFVNDMNYANFCGGGEFDPTLQKNNIVTIPRVLSKFCGKWLKPGYVNIVHSLPKNIINTSWVSKHSLCGL